MNDGVDIDIAICTFRRDHIVDTLLSIAKASVPDGMKVRVIVVDNDDLPSAKDRVLACRLPFMVDYVHAPGRNISIARNACLDTAVAPFLIFIDDDELVSTDWLCAMIAEQRASGAEIVLGPANAIYPDDAPKWMRNGDHHSSRPVYVNGDILTGYSCNTLIMRKASSVAGLRFSEDFGRSGGEDTIFLAQVHARGGRISYAPKAIVTEVVASKRVSLRWLLQRKFRFGQTHALMILQDEKNKGAVWQIRAVATAGMKCVFCFCMALVSAPMTDKGPSWLLRCVLHAGVVFQFLGGRPADIYGKDQPT